MSEHPVRLLFLEDNPADAELNARLLQRAGIVFTSRRVETRADFLAAPTGLLGGAGHSAVTATGYGNGGGCSTGTASQRTAGSAGGYFEKHITGLTPGSSITVTIGAAGTAGTDGKAGAPGICIVEW